MVPIWFWVLVACMAGYALLGGKARLWLDPWLSASQKRNLREMASRLPLSTADFVARMEQRAVDAGVVEAVRERVAQGVAYLIGGSANSAVVYPQDWIVADLGIGAGPDLEDTAVILALEKDLGICLPDQETVKVFTVEDLIHLCERRSQSAPPPPT